MKIELASIGKKFNRLWLFKNVNLVFDSHQSYALTGFNGSGKSTLLQLIYGYQVPSAGTITYTLNQTPIVTEKVFQYTTLAAPYLELPEELTLTEAVDFHFAHKQPMHTDFALMIKQAGLAGSEHKEIKYFSSGMKQRLKLVLAFNSVCEVMLLDEPCSNLDDQGVQWYREMMQQFIGKRTIIIASNQKSEYDFCNTVINVTDFKPAVPA